MRHVFAGGSCSRNGPCLSTNQQGLFHTKILGNIPQNHNNRNSINNNHETYFPTSHDSPFQIFPPKISDEIYLTLLATQNKRACDVIP